MGKPLKYQYEKDVRHLNLKDLTQAKAEIQKDLNSNNSSTVRRALKKVLEIVKQKLLEHKQGREKQKGKVFCHNSMILLKEHRRRRKLPQNQGN